MQILSYNESIMQTFSYNESTLYRTFSYSSATIKTVPSKSGKIQGLDSQVLTAVDW